MTKQEPGSGVAAVGSPGHERVAQFWRDVEDANKKGVLRLARAILLQPRSPRVRKCRHPKRERVIVSRAKGKLVQWCAACGALKRSRWKAPKRSIEAAAPLFTGTPSTYAGGLSTPPVTIPVMPRDPELERRLRECKVNLCELDAIQRVVSFVFDGLFDRPTNAVDS